MLPMVRSLSEVHQVRQLFLQARSELRTEGVEVAEELPVGIMIEVPAAVYLAHQLAKEVDFFSIGTNDLTQYLMAADRGNRRMGDLLGTFQPALIGAIKHTVDAAHAAGIKVGLCGELGRNPLATALLLGLGIDELSMSASAIPQIKEHIRQLDSQRIAEIAFAALGMTTAGEIETYLAEIA
jgi:phosphoenolpyruvate-protein kinase (PTS system EI component)